MRQLGDWVRKQGSCPQGRSLEGCCNPQVPPWALGSREQNEGPYPMLPVREGADHSSRYPRVLALPSKTLG